MMLLGGRFAVGLFFWGLYVAVSRDASYIFLYRFVFKICLFDQQVLPVSGCLVPAPQGFCLSPSGRGHLRTLELVLTLSDPRFQ